MEWIDIGVNLTSKQFRADCAAVIARAQTAGVGRMLVTGLTAESSQAALDLARSYPETLWSTAGVHPHNAKTFGPQTPAALRALALEPLVVAIGECGLDYDRDFSPRPQQRAAFERQLELAIELGMPVFLHERAAHVDFAAILRGLRSELKGGVVHCFTGSEAELEVYLELDLCIGITGFICDERRGSHLGGVVKRVPADRLMLETDAPFLRPRDLPGSGRRNEPAALPHIAEHVARHAGRSLEAVAAESTAVARGLFGI